MPQSDSVIKGESASQPAQSVFVVNPYRGRAQLGGRTGLLKQAQGVSEGPDRRAKAVSITTFSEHFASTSRLHVPAPLNTGGTEYM